MNWASNLYRAAEDNAPRAALWTPSKGYVSFASLAVMVRQTQKALRRLDVKAGDHVLLLDLPGPQLYAAAIAIVGMGATILFVEPWMPVARLNAILDRVQPKVFWSPLLGQLWASRIAQIRRIPHWIRPRSIISEGDPKEFICEDLDPAHKAILSFTSGTSGQPKGIPRTHGYLNTVTGILQKFDPETEPMPAMAIFPNLVLYHLGRGRTSLLIPRKWPDKVLKTIAAMPRERAPHSVACGPAFLQKIVACPGFDHLESIAVGGALLDCELLDAAIKRFPKAKIELIYGSTEVEPVAHADGAKALQKSRDRGAFQVVYLGDPADEITIDQKADALWVAGPHVTEEYVQAAAVDQALKHRDETGRVWHNMGDRAALEKDGLWYKGRSFQRPEDFEKEQKIYSLLQSSRSFILRDPSDRPILIGENLSGSKDRIQAAFPELTQIVESRIIRDIRHRSRIDRKLSAQSVTKKWPKP